MKKYMKKSSHKMMMPNVIKDQAIQNRLFFSILVFKFLIVIESYFCIDFKSCQYI